MSTQVGTYEIGERIGGGGMAEVFRARAIGEAGFARPVAIKRVLPHLSENEQFAEMFVNEARLAAMLTHPNIVSVINFARDPEGQLILVMELVDGSDLFQLMVTGPIPVPCGAYIAGEVLRALAYAHTKKDRGRPLGIVHRDISPQNVLLSWDGAVKVTDFGIAKAVAVSGMSGSFSIKGKLGYLSPEQMAGQVLDGRADLFSVGVIFHEMLTARPLFNGRSEAELLMQMRTMEIPRPSSINPEVTPALDAVCSKLLERDRDKRFPSAETALAELAGAGAIAPLGELALSRLLKSRFPQKDPSGAFQKVTISSAGESVQRTVLFQIDSLKPPRPAPLIPSAPTMPAQPAAPQRSSGVTDTGPEDVPTLLLPPKPAPAAEPAVVAPAVAVPAPAPEPAPLVARAPGEALEAPTTRDPEVSPLADKRVVVASLVAVAAVAVALALAFVGGSGDEVTLDPPETPVAGTYDLQLSVTPAYATVSIDGAPVGKGPFIQRSFQKDGRQHTISASAEGYEPATISFGQSDVPSRIVLVRVAEDAAVAPDAATTAPDAGVRAVKKSR